MGMSYIQDVLSPSRKEFNKYVQDDEEHLIATAEKLRIETAGLAAFVHGAEKRLRELIQLNVAAGFQLCRDVEPFGRFEFKTWQMEALPLNARVCRCEGCTGYFRNLGDFWIHGREMNNRSSKVHSAAIKGR